MCFEVSPLISEYADLLDAFAKNLYAARREALRPLARDVERDTWAFNGEDWYWPGGQAMTHFRALSPPERAVLDAFEASHGFATHGIGTGRVALTFPADAGLDDYIVKLPRYGPTGRMGDGLEQNRLERARWEASDGGPLLPIVAASDDGWWLAFPKVTPVGPAADAALYEDLADDLATLDIDNPAEDLKPENVGYTDGDVYLIDYGQPHAAADPVHPDAPLAAPPDAALTVGVDIDGVLADHLAVRCQFLKDRYGVDVRPRDLTDRNPTVTEDGLTLRESGRIIRAECPDRYGEMPLIDGCREALRALYDHGHRVVLVTHREATLRDITEAWLDAHDVPHDELWVAAPRNKADLGVFDVLIDDKSAVVEACARAGTDAVLFPRRYNADHQPDDGRVLRPEVEVEASFADRWRATRDALLDTPRDD